MALPRPEPALSSPSATSGANPSEPLSQRDRIRLAVEILGSYARARRVLRQTQIEQAIAELRAEEPVLAAQETPYALEEALRLGRAVTRLLRRMPGDTRCLARSLVLTRLLARRGIDAKLVIGARTDPDFLAHAWVEHQGTPVLDSGDGSFGRLVEL